MEWLPLAAMVVSILAAAYAAFQTAQAGKAADRAAREARDASSSSYSAGSSADKAKQAVETATKEFDARLKGGEELLSQIAEASKVAQLPKLSLEVRAHLYDSMLVLLNESRRDVHLRRVVYAGEPYDFRALASLRLYPDVRQNLPPESETSLLWAVGKAVKGQTEAPSVGESKDWQPLLIEFDYGHTHDLWVWDNRVKVSADGLLSLEMGEYRQALSVPAKTNTAKAKA